MFRPTSNRIPQHHHFEDNGEQVGLVFDSIMDSNDPEVVVDQVSNLPATKETVLLGFFCSSKLIL